MSWADLSGSCRLVELVHPGIVEADVLFVLWSQVQKFSSNSSKHPKVRQILQYQPSGVLQRSTKEIASNLRSSKVSISACVDFSVGSLMVPEMYPQHLF
ncbi:hypothetical protein CHUAL_010785 [Chamberlinius hualienensis]